MVHIGTRLKITDNTGARVAMVIGIPGGTRKRSAGIGERVTVTVKKAMPHGLVEEHSIQSVVVVRQKKEYRRRDGSFIRFDDNAAVVLDSKESKLPKGSRVFGPIARELKELGFDKIVSLAPEVL